MLSMLFSPTRALIRELGRKEPAEEALKSLSRLLEDQASRADVTLGQLWKALDLSDGLLERLGDDDPRKPLIRQINRSASREIQQRNLRGV